MIHYFNPGHETAVKNNSPYYTAPANMIVMQQDLAFLPAWYADEGDQVLVENISDNSFYSYISSYLNFAPKPIVKEKLKRYKNDEVALWGISPQGIHFVEKLNKIFELNLKAPQWSPEYIYLNSRQAARDVLTELINKIPLISDTLIPHFFSNLEDVENVVKQRPYQLLAKAPYSSSGRGLLWLPVGELTRVERQILTGILKKQESVSIERALNKQIDFAMEFMVDKEGGVHFIGYSLFETNNKGGYLGNIIASQEVIRKRIEEYVSPELLENVKLNLIDILTAKYAEVYSGCIGVDMLLYWVDDTLALHPCVEINMRSNMGLVALNLAEKYIDPMSEGKFYIDFKSKEGEMFDSHKQMMEQYPAQFSNGRLVSGYLALCPIVKGNHYRAYVLIE